MKFEHRAQPLLPKEDFLKRQGVATVISSSLLFLWILLGMAGYHVLAGFSWIDSFLNAAMIVGGMGPVGLLDSSSAKLFAGMYAILSGVILLGLFGLFAAPVFHRFLHKFHLEVDG